MARIRKQVFGLNQLPFARLAGVSQGTVSRWEAGGLEPSREQLARIRDGARELGLLWNDAWFFEEPAPASRAIASAVAVSAEART